MTIQTSLIVDFTYVSTEDEENGLSAESEDVTNEKSKRFNQFMKNVLLN